ncbi:MAG TPA: hypothetical protein VMU70_02285 [Candidatus Tyrphobacter sp.]|nr:hypothetical protein [Candidatus Tyrphobacter sp.]
MSKEFQNPFAALRDPEVARDERRLNYAFIVVVILILAVLVYFAVQKGTGRLSESGPGTCLALSEEYCASGKLVSYPQNKIFVGFNLAASSTIYAPFDGYFDFGKDGGSVEQYAETASSTGQYFEFFGYMTPLQESGAYVKKGAPVAQVTGQVIDQISNSNLLLDFQSVSPNRQKTPDLSLTHQYFSEVKI